MLRIPPVVRMPHQIRMLTLCKYLGKYCCLHMCDCLVARLPSNSIVYMQICTDFRFDIYISFRHQAPEPCPSNYSSPFLNDQKVA